MRRCAAVAVQMAAGAASFGFYCSGAPPFAKGLLVLGSRDRIHSGPVELSLGLISAVYHVESDATGYVETVVPLPTHSQGISFPARYFFQATAECPAPGGKCSSNGLFITVQ